MVCKNDLTRFFSKSAFQATMDSITAFLKGISTLIEFTFEIGSFLNEKNYSMTTGNVIFSSGTNFLAFC